MAVALTALPVKLQYQVAEPAQHDLLEALLASCQKPALNAPLPGFGRALQPYFGPNETVYPLKHGSRNKSSPSPNSKTPKKSVLTRGSTTKKAIDPKIAARKNQPATATLVSASEAEAFHAAQMATTILTSWAGPGFCNAPPPDKLPKPPLSLLD